MRSHLDRHGVVCTAAVSLLTAVAVIAPSPARGEDSLQTQLPSVGEVAEAVTAATADALPAVQTDAPRAVDVVPGLEPAPASDPAVAPEPAATPSGPALTPTPSAESTPEAPAETTQPASEKASPADITTPRTDIEADTPPAAPTPVSKARAPAPTPATAPVAANINVSVRIGSAGDNGPVTQVNVAAPTTRPLSMGADDAPAAPPAEQSSLPAAGGAAQDSPPTDSSDTWYWNWDCLGAAPVPAISPGASRTSSFPSSWTWIWNCGDNDQQYQTETLSGYQQINTNIAIRLSSPGNDGGVTQVNLGAGLTVPLPTPIQGRPFVPTPVVVPAAVDTIFDALPALAEPALAPVVTGDTTDTSVPLAPSEAPVASPSAAGGCTARLRRARRARQATRTRPRPSSRRARGAPRLRRRRPQARPGSRHGLPRRRRGRARRCRTAPRPSPRPA